MSDFAALLGTKGGPMIRPGSTMPTSSLLSLADSAWWSTAAWASPAG